MGIDSDVFVNIHESLKCPVCLDVLDDPATALCGHTCCYFCWYTIACKSTLSPKLMDCPICRRQYSVPALSGYSIFIIRSSGQSLVNNFIARQIIDDSLTKCQWSGCNKTIKYSERDRHSFECPIMSTPMVRYLPRTRETRTIRIGRSHIEVNIESTRVCPTCQTGFETYSEFRQHVDAAHRTTDEDTAAIRV